MLLSGNITIDEVLNSMVEEQLRRAGMLRELIDVRNDVKTIEEFENDDLEDILVCLADFFRWLPKIIQGLDPLIIAIKIHL